MSQPQESAKQSVPTCDKRKGRGDDEDVITVEPPAKETKKEAEDSEFLTLRNQRLLSTPEPTPDEIEALQSRLKQNLSCLLIFSRLEKLFGTKISGALMMWQDHLREEKGRVVTLISTSSPHVSRAMLFRYSGVMPTFIREMIADEMTKEPKQPMYATTYPNYEDKTIGSKLISYKIYSGATEGILFYIPKGTGYLIDTGILHISLDRRADAVFLRINGQTLRLKQKNPEFAPTVYSSMSREIEISTLDIRADILDRNHNPITVERILCAKTWA